MGKYLLCWCFSVVDFQVWIWAWIEKILVFLDFGPILQYSSIWKVWHQFVRIPLLTCYVTGYFCEERTLHSLCTLCTWVEQERLGLVLRWLSAEMNRAWSSDLEQFSNVSFNAGECWICGCQGSWSAPCSEVFCGYSKHALSCVSAFTIDSLFLLYTAVGRD